MTYLISEDSEGGYEICKIIGELFFENRIKVDTCNGISNMLDKILSLKLKADDKVIAVYDDIKDNEEVIKEYSSLVECLDDYNLLDIVTLVPVVCMEYEVTVATNIELFVDIKNHKFIQELRKFDTLDLKNEFLRSKLMTNACEIAMNDATKRVKAIIKRGKHVITDVNLEINKRYTSEKMCKALYTSKVFKQSTYIYADANYGECWKNDCKDVKCNRGNCTVQTNDKELLEEDIKRAFLIYNSYYIDIVKKIKEVSGVAVTYPEYFSLNKHKRYTITKAEVEAFEMRELLDKE